MHSPDEETEVSTLMVTAEEKQRLEAAAAFLGVTVEAFVVTAAYEAARRAIASKECARQFMGLEDFTEADVEAIRNAEPPPEAAAFDPEKGHDLDQTLAETRARFADLPPEKLQALVDEAIANARNPAKKWV